MTLPFRHSVWFVCTIAACCSFAGAQEEGFQPLFNGTDLDGWVLVNTPPETWSIEDGLLICSGKPIGEIRTEKMYQNFVLELEWRHMVPKGNAGVFVWADDITARGVPFHRSVEVQVLENAYGNSRSHTTHGDIFPIHGATMTPINGRGGSRAFPTAERSKPSPEWNHYRIECRDGAISLAVNGEVVTRGKDCSPRKGYICLESEGGIVHYRNLRIKELPDTPVDEEHVAIANRGYRSLYTGLDLAGWTTEDDQWESRDWVLAFTGEKNGSLRSESKFAEFGFVADVRLKDQSSSAMIQFIAPDGSSVDIDLASDDIAKALQKRGQWNRIDGSLSADGLAVQVNGTPVKTVTDVSNPEAERSMVLAPTGSVDFANIYVRSLTR